MILELRSLLRFLVFFFFFFFLGLLSVSVKCLFCEKQGEIKKNEKKKKSVEVELTLGVLKMNIPNAFKNIRVHFFSFFFFFLFSFLFAIF